MNPFRRILFPVDLSAVSGMVAPVVVEMAEAFDAEVHLLFVARLFKQYESLDVPQNTICGFEEKLLRGSEKGLEDFAHEAFPPGLRVRRCVRVGDPRQEIVEYAHAEDMDVVIMGTHGRKGLDRILFGSVAEHVVRTAPVPVLTVKPRAPAWQEAELGGRAQREAGGLRVVEGRGRVTP